MKDIASSLIGRLNLLTNWSVDSIQSHTKSRQVSFLNEMRNHF